MYLKLYLTPNEGEIPEMTVRGQGSGTTGNVKEVVSLILNLIFETTAGEKRG